MRFTTMMQLTQNKTETLAANTSLQVLPENPHRVALYLTLSSGAASATIAKGAVAAILGSGIILQQNGTFFETDSEGFRCWKGAIQAISTANATIAISETTEV
jgi:hypothetical protein